MSKNLTSAKSRASRWLNLYLEALRLNHERPESRQELLRQMALDDRFVGVLALLLHHQLAFHDAISRQDLAAHHGCLEHCSGSLCAIAHLLEDIQAALVEE